MPKQKKEKLEIGCMSLSPTTDRKTGSWRSFKPVITDKCTGCSTCASICPEACISIEGKDKKKAHINYDYCKGCLVCASVCPFKAIEKSDEK